jgi:hypothetical protein
VLVGEDEDVVAEDDQEITQFLALSSTCLALVAVEVRVAPQVKKRAPAEPSKVLL